MSNLFSTSGHSSSRRRNEEAEDILDRLIQHTQIMSPREKEFVEGLYRKFADYGESMIVSPKQIFWLRDLDDKCRGIGE